MTMAEIFRDSLEHEMTEGNPQNVQEVVADYAGNCWRGSSRRRKKSGAGWRRARQTGRWPKPSSSVSGRWKNIARR